MKNKIALVKSLISTYQSKEKTVVSVSEDNNLWLTQKSVADLFDCEPNNVSYHINQIYSSNKLDEKSTYQIFWIVQKEGNREVERNVKFYSLQMTIAVGFAFPQATQLTVCIFLIFKFYSISEGEKIIDLIE